LKTLRKLGRAFIVSLKILEVTTGIILWGFLFLMYFLTIYFTLYVFNVSSLFITLLKKGLPLSLTVEIVKAYSHSYSINIHELTHGRMLWGSAYMGACEPM